MSLLGQFGIFMLSVLPECMSVHHVTARCLHRLEDGVEFPRTRVTDGCESPHGCLDLMISSSFPSRSPLWIHCDQLPHTSAPMDSLP